jgi:replicative DNA helicase Mcm
MSKDDLVILSQQYENFFRYFQVGERFKYRERIEAMPAKNEISLYVDFDDLLNYDRKLAQDLLENPDIHIEEASETLKRLIALYDDEYAKTIRKFYVRFKGLPEENHVDVRNIRARHINKLIAIEGVVSKVSTVKHVIVEGALRCPVCKEEFKVQPDEEGKIRTSGRCPNPDCEYNGKMILLKEKSMFMDIQRMFIQEKPENLPPGQLPRSLEVLLVEDLVDKAQPGNRVIVVGIVRIEKERMTQDSYYSYIEANSIELKERSIEDIYISNEDEETIVKMSKDPLIVDKIIDSIAPSIYGYRHVKESIAYQLFGGIPKTAADGTRIRGDINILLVGDPGTGKTQILRYVASLVPRGLYTSGKGSTAAGLTAAVVRDKLTNEFYLEAGALVLADGGIACIDEIDKMRSEDRSAMHEAMEQQTVSIAKAGIVATLNARTAILAAANPHLGRFDINKTVIENINLPETLLSRFDLIWPIRDIPEPEQDEKLSDHILSLHQHPESKIGTIIPPDLLRKYIVYARRNVKPRISDEAKELIKNFYKSLRTKAISGGPIPITARQLEAIIRLSEARAKIRLSDVVTAEDAQAAINLMEKMLRETLYDKSMGTINIDMIYTGMPGSKKELAARVVKTIKEAGGEMEEEQLISKLESEGNSRENIEEVLRILRRNGEIYESKPGYIKIIS